MTVPVSLLCVTGMSAAGAPEQGSPVELQPPNVPPEEDDDPDHGDQVVCMKCDEQVPVSKTLSAGRPGCRVCKLCYNACRSLAGHYRKRGKKDEWDKMPAAKKKKKLIKENKHGGGIRGKERTIRITEEARHGTKNMNFDTTPNKTY